MEHFEIIRYGTRLNYFSTFKLYVPVAFTEKAACNVQSPKSSVNKHCMKWNFI